MFRQVPSCLACGAPSAHSRQIKLSAGLPGSARASRPSCFSKAVLSAYWIRARVELIARLHGIRRLVQMRKPVNRTNQMSLSSPVPRQRRAMPVMACNLTHDVSGANFTTLCEGRCTFSSTCLHFGTSPHASDRSGQEDSRPARLYRTYFNPGCLQHTAPSNVNARCYVQKVWGHAKDALTLQSLQMQLPQGSRIKK